MHGTKAIHARYQSNTKEIQTTCTVPKQYKSDTNHMHGTKAIQKRYKPHARYQSNTKEIQTTCTVPKQYKRDTNHMHGTKTIQKRYKLHARYQRSNLVIDKVNFKTTKIFLQKMLRRKRDKKLVTLGNKQV